MRPVLLCSSGILAGLAVSVSMLAGQAAVDPSIAPRAARLALGGDRPRATEMLGRYLATAPDDGAAWLELGKLYLADSRAWHQAGHRDEPDGALYLDFAATALDQSLRLPTDSAYLLRALVEVDRAAELVETDGWAAARAAFLGARSTTAPDFVEELGRNLVNSCPVGGVLVTGTDLEAVAVWAAASGLPARGDLVLLLGPLFASDSLYRTRMETALALAGQPDPGTALAAAAATRPVCLSPDSDAPWAGAGTVTVVRLVRVVGPIGPEVVEPLRVADLLEAAYARPDAVSAEVLAVYQEAARFNPALCLSVLAPVGVRGREACGR
jgi:hypothetical protein